MPSTRAKPPEPPPTIFTDRSLAKKAVPNGIRALGFEVLTIWDVYGLPAADTLDDDVWLRDSARNGWLALTWDMLRKAEWRQVIAEEETKVFRFERRHTTPDEKLRVFAANRHRLVQRARKPGGWIDVIREDRIDRYWP